ncbi:hypothetical protein LJC44_06530 [Parabacteroides sp. OttesenSCG-928-G06]|nr:hypothetical protein [Parabacteroides sp. OttesenSCG-928-G06]
MKIVKFLLAITLAFVCMTSCSSDDDDNIAKLNLPVVYNIKAYTNEVVTSKNPIGSVIKESVTKGTITITEQSVKKNFNPETNGGIGVFTCIGESSVIKIDKNKIYYGVGDIIYIHTLNDGRKVLIDEVPEDDCYMYWVIE